MQELLILLVVVLACTTVFFGLQWSAVKARLLAASTAPQTSAPKAQKALGDDGKKEIDKLKEELAKKARLVEELREEAKKKARREGKKAAAEEEKASAGPDPRDVEIQGLKKGMSALESQLNNAKNDAERATAELERLRGDSSRDDERQAKARDDERNKHRSLADENAALKRTLEELRAAKRKETERPEVPGTTLDLKALPVEAVQELARYFRKGEDFERLYNVAGGQLQLEKDRYQDLQRRYFAVCRELALAAGAQTNNDADARAAAEKLVQGTEQLARSQAPAGAAAAAAPAGEANKKRRRRRKKKPGSPDGAVVEAADGDEADDGEDDVDDDVSADAAVLSTTTETPAGSGAQAS